MSKDTKSSDSLRKALVRIARETDVAVTWLSFELVVEKGRRPPLERKLLVPKISSFFP